MPQLFLGSLLGTCISAIGQFFSLSLVTVPGAFANVNSAQFPSLFLEWGMATSFPGLFPNEVGRMGHIVCWDQLTCRVAFLEKEN